LKYSDLKTWKPGYDDMDSEITKYFTSYLSKDGSVYKVGDKLTIGVPLSNKSFAHITEAGSGRRQLDISKSGDETEIKRIYVGGSKRTGYSVYFRTKGYDDFTNYIIRIENAIATGEIKGFGMTSDEALSELKKAKDKLDLGLITQAKFDSLKADLVKYIK
jgi:hypothetical protein